MWRLTFVPLQLVLGHVVCAAVKVFLQRVHLPAQDVSEGLHLCQLLSQPVALLRTQQKQTSQYLHGAQRKPFQHVCRHHAEAGGKHFPERSP